MVNSGGGVTNDYQRDMEGYRVFVVTAQTPADGRSPEKYWNFYFTEITGELQLTTNTPLPFSDAWLPSTEIHCFIHATSEKKRQSNSFPIEELNIDTTGEELDASE